MLVAILPQLASAHNSMVKNGDNAEKSTVTVNNNSALVTNAPNFNVSNVQTQPSPVELCLSVK